MIKVITFSLFIISMSFSQIPSSLLSTISPELQKKLTLKNSESIDYLNINKYSDNKLSQLPLTADSLDTTAQNDSLSEIKHPDKYSIYQNIIRGDTINPDSILQTLSIFGQDLFTNKHPSNFAPSDNFIVPSDYVINTDDEIIILLWGRINEEYRLKVNREGNINIPRIGPVQVSGLPYESMQNNILSRVKQIEGVNVSVSVGTMRSIGIFIVGEVTIPGYYMVSALSNVTNALFIAGGPNKNGSLRNIQLKRNEKLIANIDLYDFLLKGNDKTNLRLEAGDVIHVPIISKMVAVAGNVRRSALYEVLNDEKLDVIIKFAGGFSPAAWTNRIQIQRLKENKSQEIIDIDSSQLKLSLIPINDGDIIKVLPILFKNQNAVYLEGNVLRPGKYEYKQGMRVTDLIQDYKQLLSETYLDYALIIRQDPPQFHNRLLTFNLKDALDNPASEKNILLQSRDKLLIYSRDYFEPDRTVEIMGSITTPGKIKLLHNMTIRDLILQAGGLSEDASSSRGELYRRTVQENDAILTEKIDFCVDCAINNDPEHNYILNKSDRVFIRSKLGWEKESKVILKGQFKYPGIYVIFEGETLGELINRAGGYTKNAYLSAAVFTRVSVKEKEKIFFDEYNNQIEQEIINLSNELAVKTDPLEAAALLEQQKALKKDLSKDYKFGRVVIDLNNTKNYQNFVLENNDELFIPRNLNTISVLGEVFNPSTFKFENTDNTVSFYLEAAGGLKTSSDSKHIYIIKANGSIVTNNTIKILKASLEPGDAIVVPQKIKYSNPQKVFVDTVDAIFKVSSLLATILAIVISIN